MSELVGCGFPSYNPDIDVRIVDPKSLEQLPDARVGEIWVSSPSKAQGYYGLVEKSREDFEATLKNTDFPLFLRTGMCRILLFIL